MFAVEVFSKDQIETIHQSSLWIMEKVGVKANHEGALKYFADAGATIDEKKRVHFSASLVQEAIKSVPRSFVWRARDPKHNIRFGSGKTYLLPSAGCVYILDLEGKRRPGTVKDIQELAVIADALPNIHGGGGFAIQPADVDPRAAHAHFFYHTHMNTTKPVIGHARCIVGNDVAADLIRMAEVIWGGEEELMKEPTILSVMNPRSPLELDKTMIESIIEYSKKKQPLVYASFVIVGASGPITLAGAMAQHNAEVLSGIILSQLVSPGVPCVYGCASGPIDMRGGSVMIGSPEAYLMATAAVQMAKFYGMPSRASCIVSDSKIPDAQAGFESMMGALLGGSMGLDLNLHAGVLESYLTTSPAKMIIDNEICGMVERFLRGIEVNQDTLALDLIAKCAEKGYFLGEEHTRKYYTKEYFMPSIADKQSYPDWEKKGGLDTWKRANEQAKKILAEHRPPSLEKGIQAELESIVRDVDKRWAKS